MFTKLPKTICASVVSIALSFSMIAPVSAQSKDVEFDAVSIEQPINETALEEANSFEAISEAYEEQDLSDAALFDTDDAETITLLNQMSEEFEAYGEQGEYDALPLYDNAATLPDQATPYGWKEFANCVGSGIARAYGLDVLKQAFNHEVRQALKSRQWKVASAIMHRNLKRILGKKGASWVIKKIAHKALPGGLAGQIAWQVGKCGFKEIFS